MSKSATESFGFQTIDAATLAAGASALNVPEYAEYCLVQCEGGVVRWRDDSVAPTASVGMRLTDGGELKFDATMSDVKFIKSSGTPVLMVAFYG